MKPIGVKIVTTNDLLTAGHPVPLRCDSWGSYPTAKITWLLDGEPIRNADVTTHSDRDVCTYCLGEIYFVFTKRDNDEVSPSELPENLIIKLI